MNILILGATGILGPQVVKNLENKHHLRLTDITDRYETDHEYRVLDISNPKEVMAAAESMDVIVNLAVNRTDRQHAFDANALGCHNVMMAAVRHGIRKVVNTGPDWAIWGPSYATLDFDLTVDAPPQPGTRLYAITKSLGLEICRVFTENHDVFVISLLFPHIHTYPPYEGGVVSDDAALQFRRSQGLTLDHPDTAAAIRRAVDIEPRHLPSRFEVFNVIAGVPHRRYSPEKTKRILGWEPANRLEELWQKR